MIGPDFVRTMASYNSWQNENLYSAASGLAAEDRRADRGAFFGSIFATLNHLLWGDRIWMARLADGNQPGATDIAGSVDECANWDELTAARTAMDAIIKAWSHTVTTADLSADLSWFSGAIDAQVSKPKWFVVTHVFNHQTHHRGQVHAMLTAAGARPNDTDLFILPQR
jgi:uncharacterized damage-inducible protein DinB